MENQIIFDLKNILSNKDKKRFELANFQDWYILELYRKARTPKLETVKKQILIDLDQLDGGAQ